MAVDASYRAATFDEVKTAYAEQIRGLIDGGVDLLLPETTFDTLNLKACIVALEEVFEEKQRRLPLMLSVTIIDKNPEAFWRYPPGDGARQMVGLGFDRLRLLYGLRDGGLFRLRLGVRGGLRRIDREHNARPPSRGLEPDGPARAVRLPFDSGLGVHLSDPDLPELAEMAGQGAEVRQLCPQLGR